MNDIEMRNHYEYKRFKEKYFSGIIGLDKVIGDMFAIYAMTEINKMKEKYKIPVKKQALNMIFYGNPGTGKTTIARKVAEMFKDINYLSKGHLTEIDRSDLIGEYIGQTSIKTKTILEEAKGGVLFIDEAYSLYNEEYSDFGNEAIDIILKFVEDHHDDFIVIFAGYKDKIDRMLKNNKGLKSRFPIKIFFEDYDINELKQIFRYTIKVNGYECTKAFDKKFEQYLLRLARENDEELTFNGRFIRNLIEGIIRKHDLKIFINKIPHDKLMILDEDDFIEKQKS